MSHQIAPTKNNQLQKCLFYIKKQHFCFLYYYRFRKNENIISLIDKIIIYLSIIIIIIISIYRFEGTTGAGGRLASHGSTLSSYIVKNIALQKVSTVKEDPREALLKYAKVAESDPYWISPAYSQTQPKVSSFTISHLRLYLCFMLIVICFFFYSLYSKRIRLRPMMRKTIIMLRFLGRNLKPMLNNTCFVVYFNRCINISKIYVFYLTTFIFH